MPTSEPRPLAVRSAIVVALVAPLAVAPLAAADPDEQASVSRPRPRAREPVVQPQPVTAPEREPTAADVAGAPLPGEEHGRSDGVDGGDSTARVVGRGLLFFPRLLANGVLAPLRAGVWAIDRYQLPDRYTRTFFNDAETVGLYPTLVIDTSLGIFAGGRFVHHDLFGAKEQVMLQAAWGNRFRQIYSASFRSGERFDRVRFELDLAYERRPHDSFYGIGNGDEMTEAGEPPGPPIDPLTSSAAIESHFRSDRKRVAMVTDVRIAGDLHLRPAASVSEVGFGPGDEGEAINERFDEMGLVGFDGIRYGYGELGLRWDSRRGGRGMEPQSVYAAGTMLDLYGGRVHRLDDGPDFWRYGLDAQRFLRLGKGPRVVSLRLHGEAVTGERDEVPFSELPMLGGPVYLRGYSLDRFRDRVAAFGSVQYSWDLAQWFSANAFVDAGRVFPRLEDLSLDDLRVGYGLGIEGHTLNSFVAEASIASSIDGGISLNLSFNRVFDLDERVRRK